MGAIYGCFEVGDRMRFGGVNSELYNVPSAGGFAFGVALLGYLRTQLTSAGSLNPTIVCVIAICKKIHKINSLGENKNI